MERRSRTPRSRTQNTRRRNIASPPPRNSSKSSGDIGKSQSRGRPFLSILRGILFLTFLVGICLFISAIFLKKEIQVILARKITNSSSVVYSRPLPLTTGISIKKIHLEDRLNRLNFRKVESVPVRSGEFSLNKSNLKIYLKETFIRPDQIQASSLFDLTLSEYGEIQEIREGGLGKPTQIIWIEPEVLSSLGDSSQRAVNFKNLNDFSQDLKNALLAVEDEHFYYHVGIDPVSIVRATLVNLKSGKVVQGGSTLTQQLAKNLFFSSERSIFRKIKEALAAVVLETAYSKDQIFEMYLNEIFLGQEGRFAIHGFGEASKSFFGKEISDVNLAEAALLAGMVKAPSSYSPRNHLEEAQERQRIVLGRMESLEMITSKQRSDAEKFPIKTFSAVRSRRIAPYFVDYLTREVGNLLSDNSIDDGAFKIVSGLDLEYQNCADSSVESGIEQLLKTYPYLKRSKEPLQAALISVVPSSGEIRAWVGGRDFGESQFDRISLAKRQPGSTFKPFVYLTALDGTLNQYKTAKTTSILMDEPTTIDVPGNDEWSPQNYDKEYRGQVRLRDALALSLNVPTVNLAQKVGIKSIANTARLFGFGDDLPAVPSLALGAGEVTPLALAQAYSIIANGGIKRSLHPFFYVMNTDSYNIKYQRQVEENRIVGEPATYILTDILRTAIERGTGTIVRKLGVEGAIAGKTGTTNDARDSWFVGFTPKILTVVWVGFDSNKPIKLTGAQAAAPIWASYMKCIAPMEPNIEFIAPPGVVQAQLDRESGLLFTPSCPEHARITELFVKDTEPVTPCPIHSEEGSKLVSEVEIN